MSVQKHAALCVRIDEEKEGRILFEGKNVKLTCVVGGRVVGRLIVNWDHAPALHGGEFPELYWCHAWKGELFIYAEALGEGACLTGAKFLSA